METLNPKLINSFKGALFNLMFYGKLDESSNADPDSNYNDVKVKHVPKKINKFNKNTQHILSDNDDRRAFTISYTQKNTLYKVWKATTDEKDFVCFTPFCNIQ